MSDCVSALQVIARSGSIVSHHQPCHGLPHQHRQHAHHLHHHPAGGQHEEQAVTSQPSNAMVEDRRMVTMEEMECKEAEEEECPAYSKIILEHTVRLFCLSLLG